MFAISDFSSLFARARFNSSRAARPEYYGEKAFHPGSRSLAEVAGYVLIRATSTTEEVTISWITSSALT